MSARRRLDRGDWLALGGAVPAGALLGVFAAMLVMPGPPYAPAQRLAQPPASVSPTPEAPQPPLTPTLTPVRPVVGTSHPRPTTTAQRPAESPLRTLSTSVARCAATLAEPPASTTTDPPKATTTTETTTAATRPTETNTTTTTVTSPPPPTGCRR